MYLKSIEVQGFKSFANKIIFDFHNGITGIVGPNGSGKSNVADAVRWVLGEQKVKQLRSSSMQDVIFAGTENRKPVSFAYVAITLDNSDRALGLDYNEITVARRVYRSGESEYLLNGTQCRLKDIHELFYDTGIGKEGYSIIGQGQIDRILSGKPEERRELFDEAAGIVKFKRRKLMTVKKLESEQQNMVRITDILNELERQIGPLARQSEQARIYLKKKEELKTQEIGLFLQEMQRVETESAQVGEKLAIAEAQQQDTTAEHEKLRSSYEALGEAMEEADLSISRLQGQISEADVEKEKLEGHINVLKEQIHTIEQNESHVKERLEELSADVARRQETGQGYSDEKAVLDQEADKARAYQQQMEQQLHEMQQRVAQCEARQEAGKEKLLSLLDERSVIKGEQQRFHTMMEQADIRKAQLQQQILRQQSADTDVSGQLKESEESLDTLNERILRMEKKKIEVDQKRRKWKQQAAELEEELGTLRRQMLKDASRLETLKNIAERYDGYGNSIRRVMEKKADTPGIRGVVADLIQVQKRYEIAIETALGGSIQNIVTDNEQTAKQMIAFLKEHRYGRATFLPLTSVSAPDHVPAKKALSEQGVIGMADTLVKTAKEYENIAASLLGRVLVVDTIDHATAIARKFHYSLRIVTLEGELLQPGGSMTGGAFKNNSNLLGRNREIEALEKAISDCTNREKKIHDRLEDVKTAEELLVDDFEEIQTALQDFYLRQNTLQVEVEHMREEKAQQESFYQTMQSEMQALEEEKETICLDKEQALLRLKRSKESEAQIAEENARLTQELAQLHGEAEQQQEAVAKAQVALAQIEQKADFARENIQRVAEEILALEQTKQEVLTNASNSGQEIQARQDEIATADAGCKAAVERRERLAEQLAVSVSEKEEMSKNHRAFLEQREEISKELARLDKELFRLQDQQEKLEQTREKQTDYIWQEYELTLHEAKEFAVDTELSVSERKKQIATVKDEIRALGHVNVNAIEEYKDVAARYEFLKGQHEDLAQAEKTLLDIIADLDDGMKKQFAEKFADIQGEFDKAFKELFGGGKGTLELAIDDEKDILECGVRIIAQPPGKKLQNMMQLSGGEKALTAIALLFAIQNLKPSPFCLLDEIEAALDDPNVERYARYLHKLTKHTQFIIITHRRGTMIAADRLYGITMQEKGVSALVSVNLIEKELDA